MTLRRAILKWPDSPGLQEMMTKTERPESQMVDILHVVEPRENGVRGSVRDRKPWRDVNVLVDKTEVLEVGGHERFKYNVGRFQKRSGDAAVQAGERGNGSMGAECRKGGRSGQVDIAAAIDKFRSAPWCDELSQRHDGVWSA